MSTLSQALNTARDALTAQSYGLSVTGQNIANASTPEYVRREAILETRAIGTANSSGTVQVSGLRRATDIYTERQYLKSNSLASSASEHSELLSRVEVMFNDTETSGLGTSLSQMFNSFTALAANPSDPTTRNNVLNRAGDFVAQANQVGNALAQTRDELLVRAQETVRQVNEKASVISNLNRKIAVAEAMGNDSADLRDQRDRVLLDLSSLIDVHTFTDGQGSLVVQSAGVSLVEGDHSRKLVLDLAPGGNLRLQAETSSGSLTEVTRFLTGGKLAGIQETRDVDLLNIGQGVDQLVFEVASAVNAVHAAGVGLDGGSGRNLFDVSGGATGAARNIRIDADLFNQPDRIAAAGSALALPGDSANAVDLAAVGRQALAGLGTRTAAEAYGDAVGNVAVRVSSAFEDSELRGNIFEQAQTMKQSLSSVSLDEEMIALTKFQRAYQASARVLTTVDELLEDLMARI